MSSVSSHQQRREEPSGDPSKKPEARVVDQHRRRRRILNLKHNLEHKLNKQNRNRNRRHHHRIHHGIKPCVEDCNTVVKSRVHLSIPQGYELDRRPLADDAPSDKKRRRRRLSVDIALNQGGLQLVYEPCELPATIDRDSLPLNCAADQRRNQSGQGGQGAIVSTTTMQIGGGAGADANENNKPSPKMSPRSLACVAKVFKQRIVGRLDFLVTVPVRLINSKLASPPPSGSKPIKQITVTGQATLKHLVGYSSSRRQEASQHHKDFVRRCEASLLSTSMDKDPLRPELDVRIILRQRTDLALGPTPPQHPNNVVATAAGEGFVRKRHPRRDDRDRDRSHDEHKTSWHTAEDDESAVSATSGTSTSTGSNDNGSASASASASSSSSPSSRPGSSPSSSSTISSDDPLVTFESWTSSRTTNKNDQTSCCESRPVCLAGTARLVAVASSAFCGGLGQAAASATSVSFGLVPSTVSSVRSLGRVKVRVELRDEDDEGNHRRRQSRKTLVASTTIKMSPGGAEVAYALKLSADQVQRLCCSSGGKTKRLALRFLCDAVPSIEVRSTRQSPEQAPRFLTCDELLLARGGDEKRTDLSSSTSSSSTTNTDGSDHSGSEDSEDSSSDDDSDVEDSVVHVDLGHTLLQDTGLCAEVEQVTSLNGINWVCQSPTSAPLTVTLSNPGLGLLYGPVPISTAGAFVFLDIEPDVFYTLTIRCGLTGAVLFEVVGAIQIKCGSNTASGQGILIDCTCPITLTGTISCSESDLAGSVLVEIVETASPDVLVTSGTVTWPAGGSAPPTFEVPSTLPPTAYTVNIFCTSNDDLLDSISLPAGATTFGHVVVPCTDCQSEPSLGAILATISSCSGDSGQVQTTVRLFGPTPRTQLVNFGNGNPTTRDVSFTGLTPGTTYTLNVSCNSGAIILGTISPISVTAGNISIPAPLTLLGCVECFEP